MTKLIANMELARESHLDWARHQEKRRRKGLERLPHVGSSTFHRRWVKIYDQVILKLKHDSEDKD